MKKILVVSAFAAILMLPFTSLAMTSIEESDLAAVTGQSGVSINLDTNINLHIDAIAWGDKDGLATTEASGAGWIGVQDLNANVRISTRQDLLTALWGPSGLGAEGLRLGAIMENSCPDYAIAGNNLRAGIDAYRLAHPTWSPTEGAAWIWANPQGWSAEDHAALDPTTSGLQAVYITELNAVTSNPDFIAYANFKMAHWDIVEAAIYAWRAIQPLTIDVATDSGTNHGVANTTFVRIGLGSIGIYVSDMDLTPALGSSPGTLNQELGDVYIGGLDILINKASYVDIYNGRGPGTQGVTLGMNVVIDAISVDELSWGDTDGFVLAGNGSTIGTTINANAGYVGLQNTTIAGLNILGPVTIDVATDDGLTAGFKQAGVQTTFVRIGFEGLNVVVGDLDTTVVLSRTKDFSTAAVDTLGSIYMSTLDITFDAGSVDIYNYTGKSGVVLDFDLAIATLDIATLSWGDSDGVSAGFDTTDIDNPGFVGLKSLAITDLTVGGIVTIDVATVLGTDVGPSVHAVGTTFVRIGFGDAVNGLAIGIGSMDATVALGTAKDNLAQELGSIYISSLTAIVGGNLDISAASASTQGVVFNMDLTIDVSDLDAVSWGDSDGIGGATTAGYVGLKDLTIGTMTVVGKVAIDVASVTAPPAQVGLIDDVVTMMYGAYYSHMMSPNSQSFVHIALGTGDGTDDPFTTDSLKIGIASLGFDIALDSAPTLAGAGLGTGSGGGGMLGSVYMGTVDVRVNGWVDIAAH